MSIKFNGIMSEVVTFEALSAINESVPVSISGNGRVAATASGAAFIGVAVNHSKGLQGVKIHGYVELSYTSVAPSLGHVKLVADGNGGIKVDADKGREYLVVSVNTATKKVGILLGL